MSPSEIRTAFNEHLRDKDDFLGVVDSEGVTLQFIVEDDGTYWTEVPHPERRGSSGRKLSLNEVTQLLERPPGSLRHIEDELNLEFKAW